MDLGIDPKSEFGDELLQYQKDTLSIFRQHRQSFKNKHQNAKLTEPKMRSAVLEFLVTSGIPKDIWTNSEVPEAIEAIAFSVAAAEKGEEDKYFG